MTPEQAAIEVAGAVGRAIKDLGSVPSGHLYARLMGHMSLDDYDNVIEILTRTGLVEQKNYLLRWIGPT